jgi:hypothetical protein
MKLTDLSFRVAAGVPAHCQDIADTVGQDIADNIGQTSLTHGRLKSVGWRSLPWGKASVEAQCQELVIGRSFGRLPIGLTSTGPMYYRVYFAKLYLGHLDLKAGRNSSLHHTKFISYALPGQSGRGQAPSLHPPHSFNFQNQSVSDVLSDGVSDVCRSASVPADL